MASSLTELQALVKLKKSFTNAASLDSWGLGTTPCNVNGRPWIGISCENGLVSILSLEDSGLLGSIDIDALLELKGLRVVSFKNNSFSGPIPDFNRLGALKAIFLSENQFSGEIPSDYFANMDSLKKVWFGGNNFSGPIPESLANLHNLTELHLENNQFSGSIPSLEQPTLESLDLSNNLLEGEIPASLNKFNERSFQGNAGLCGESIGTACNDVADAVPPTGSGDQGNVSGSSSSKTAAGLMAVAVVLLCIMIGAIHVMRQRQKKFNLLGKEDFDDAVEVRTSGASKKDMGSIRKGNGSSRRGSHKGSGGDLVLVNEESGTFGLTDLMKAGAEVLGNGTLGSSYKAMMSNGMTVVVKRIKDMNKLGKEGFEAEVRRLGRLRHQNVLSPLAYHYRKDEKLLINKYVAKGSLLYLLHGDRGLNHAELNWPVRLKIVQGIARGLGYLHTELASANLPHGNLKSSNVLLGPDFEPLVVDYGFSPLVNNAQAVQALLAYKSPEATQTHETSPKCDVYCLGIIILEILTGKFPSQYLNHGKGGIDIVDWVRAAISEERGAELFDPEIINSRNSLGEMEKLLRIGAACTESNPDQRPEITEAIRWIEDVHVEGAGGQEARTVQVPRQGYAEAAAPESTHLLNVQDGYAGRRMNSIGERSARRTSDSFAFDIS
ncbi:hypothetical protein RHGRI_025176 [Rhododendron griersonianum]|uniref:Protein kinase domain-containing protein n=1 Tax=Rhododendron griersonianum TaxID=479676 RepID=A0AAV6JEK4_9ERIC|nr:hypothetical protein RHGRI_025176 [Rhododendron griersonianum]